MYFSLNINFMKVWKSAEKQTKCEIMRILVYCAELHFHTLPDALLLLLECVLVFVYSVKLH